MKTPLQIRKALTLVVEDDGPPFLPSPVTTRLVERLLGNGDKAKGLSLEGRRAWEASVVRVVNTLNDLGVLDVAKLRSITAIPADGPPVFRAKGRTKQEKAKA